MKHLIHYGDVFYIRKSGKETGSEQKAGRPAVVVSNDVNNRKAPTVNVVYLSDKDPCQVTHIWLPSRGRLRGSTATCEQVTTVSKLRIGDFITHLSVAEMNAISQGLRIQLNIGTNA